MSTQSLEPLRFLQYENKRLRQENQELSRELALLHNVIDALRGLQEVTSSITAETSVIGLLDRILESALRSIGASDGSLLLTDEETQELVFVVVHGAVREQLIGYRIPLGQGIAGWVAQNAKPVILKNARLDPRFLRQVDDAFHFVTQSMVCVPIVYGDRVAGVIQALNKVDWEDFNDGDLTLLQVVAQLAATAMLKAEETFLEAHATS